MSKVGIKVSKEGKDVKNTTQDSLVFNSNKPSFSVIEKDTWDMTIEDGLSENIIEIDTDIVNPFFYSYVNLINGYYPLSPQKCGLASSTGYDSDDLIWGSSWVWENKAYIKIYRYYTSGEETFNGVYYVISREIHKI